MPTLTAHEMSKIMQNNTAAQIGVDIKTKSLMINSDIKFGASQIETKNDLKIIQNPTNNGYFLGFILNGELKFNHQSGAITHKKGQIVMGENSVNELEFMRGKSQNIYIFLSQNFMNNNFDSLIKSKFKAIFEKQISQTAQISLAQILSLNEDDPLDKLLMDSKILQIIHSEFSLLGVENQNVIIDDFAKNKLLNARAILSSNLKNPPSIKELSKSVRLNEFKLKFGFKKLFNQTPYEFVRDERLKEAFTLLQSSELNIAEISQLLGFKNQSHFSKLFFNHYGTQPKNIVKSRKYYY